MKKTLHYLFGDLPNCGRIFLLMCVAVLTVTHAAAQEVQPKITIKLNQASFADFIQNLKRQTNYEFVFNTNDVAVIRPITLDVKNAMVDAVLKQVLSGTKLEYTISGRTIVIKVAPVKQNSVAPATQKLMIKGRILGQDKKPLVGAAIIVLGTNLGTSADQDGAFVLQAENNSKLEISYFGMETVIYDKPLSANTDIVVELQQKSMGIEDVVVTGIFSARKNTYTGAATTISKKDIENISPTNIFSVLQVLDPSFRITENNILGSDPNALPEFQLRGASSLTMLKQSFDGDPNMPLFMLDGFEVGLEKVFDIDPLRIESVTILKDASATAIYGSKASNGVVVIELKRPEKGELRVDYIGKYILTAPDLSSYNLLNARQKFELEEITGTITPLTTIYNERLKSVLRGQDTYWLNKPLRVSNDFTHNLNVSGGDDNVTYSVNVNYAPNSGVMIGSGRDKIGLSNQLQYRKNNFNVTNVLSYDRMVSNQSPYGSFATYAKLNPYNTPYDDEGNYKYFLEEKIINPLWNTKLKEINRTRYNLLTENLNLTWWVTPELKLSGSGSVNIKNSDTEQFFSSQHTRFSKVLVQAERGSYSKHDTEHIDYQATLQASYNSSFGGHYLSLNAAYNVVALESKTLGVEAIGFMSDNLTDPSFANSYEKDSRPEGSSLMSRSMGVVGNVNYSYKDIYFADLSVRGDISSRFGKDSRWAPFWSAGVGYNLHKEKFFQNIDFIDQLKIRYSCGITGSQNYDPYQAMTKYAYISDKFYNIYSIGALMKGLGNNNLKWQRAYNKNLGLDMGVMNRLSLSLNYYIRTSKDLLVPINMPPSLGFTSYMQNLGESENRGYEIGLRAVLVKKKDMNLAVSLNGSHNVNKLLKISNALSAWNKKQDEFSTLTGNIKIDKNQADEISRPKVLYIEGESMNTIWVVESRGIDPANGKELYVDKDGNLTYAWSPDDQVPFATTDSKLDGSMGVNFSWKGFTVNAYAQYSYGGKIYNTTLMSRVENVDFDDNCDVRVFTDRWKERGSEARFKSLSETAATKPTSRFIQDNNFLRMSSLNLSYRFSNRMLERMKYFKSFVVGFGMEDLFYLSTIKQERGLEYPYAKKFSFSLQLSF